MRDFLRFSLSLAFIASGAALFSSSCSGPTLPDKDILLTVSYDDFVKDHDYSGSVRLLAGGTLTIRLFSNGTTGSSWTDPAEISDPSVLAQTGHVYVPPVLPSPGAGGQEVWTFRADGIGPCVVYTEYKRPSDVIPTWTFTLTVTVM
jgi:predicted secreted protein